MNERDQATVAKLFGPTATLGGMMGSGLGPGRLEVRINGFLVGWGRNFREAIAAAQQTLAALARRAG